LSVHIWYLCQMLPAELNHCVILSFPQECLAPGVGCEIGR
jgi:hypothetical protein